MMLLLRSLLNGVGSGAGVAWPFFSIVFAIFGFSMGSSASFILGSVSLLLFMTITPFIFYFSYQEIKGKRASLEKDFQEQKTNLEEDIKTYRSSGMVSQNILILASHSEKTPLKDLVRILRENKETDTQHIMDLFHHSLRPKRIPLARLFIPATFNFIAAFGAIAGCSAGVSGLLTGIGILSSLAAFPVLGCAIIATATLCGVMSATGAINESRRNYQKKKLTKIYASTHQVLRDALDREGFPSQPTSSTKPVSARKIPSLFGVNQTRVLNPRSSSSEGRRVTI